MSNASPKDAVTSGETPSGLPILPATTPLAHNAIQIRIKIESVYTKEGLIEVQRGGMPPKCDEIIVVDMSDIREPDPGNTRDVIAYRQAKERNRVAMQSKIRMVIEARNRLHSLVLEMLQPNHAHLAEQVHSVCDMGSEDYGIQYYDGVRADAMMMRVIVPPGGKSETTRSRVVR